MAVNLDQATTAYGVTADLINAIPALQGKLQEAIKGGWSQDKLNAEIAQTDWYRQHGQDVRNLLMQHATDPATYNENIANAQKLVQQVAGQYGRTVDAKSLAYQYLANGWTQQTLQDVVGHGALETNQGALVGDAAQLQSHLEQTAQAYGVAYTDSYLKGFINRIQQGHDTVDGFDAVMKARAKAAYPQFADQLDGGQTLAQIADPYMATMAKTLEIPQTEVKLTDPMIRKALSVKDPKTGAMTSQPLYDFEHQLKDDPRYDKTDQAKTDAYSLLAQIGKDWGFTGGGSVN